MKRRSPKKIWKTIMSQYLQDKQKKSYTFDSSVVSAVYCKESGLLANPGVCTDTGVGWYEKDELPATCNIDHSASGASSVSPDSSLNPASGNDTSSAAGPGSQADSSQSSDSQGSSSSSLESSSPESGPSWNNSHPDNHNQPITR